MNTKNRLTKEEINYINKHYKTQTPSKIAAVLQRPKTTIRGYLERHNMFILRHPHAKTKLKQFLDNI